MSSINTSINSSVCFAIVSIKKNHLILLQSPLTCKKNFNLFYHTSKDWKKLLYMYLTVIKGILRYSTNVSCPNLPYLPDWQILYRCNSWLTLHLLSLPLHLQTSPPWLNFCISGSVEREGTVGGWGVSNRIESSSPSPFIQS